MSDTNEGAWETPRTPDELHAWLREEIGLIVPRGPLIATHDAPFDYLVHAFFETPGVRDCVVWANRGGGKTFLGAVATMLDLVFKPGIEVRILGGSMDQSRRMHAHLRRLFDPRTSEGLAAMVRGRMGEKRLTLTNGSEVELLAQSHTSVRGTRVQKLRCDEVDLFHPDVWEAAQLVTRSKDCGGVLVRGSVECLSTMHRPFGVMHTLVGEARGGSRRLFRWGVVDVLAHCTDDRACSTLGPGAESVQIDALEPGQACPLWRECRGRARRRPPERAGHISIDDAVAMKRRVSLATWEAEMLCLRPRRTDAVLPEFDPGVHVLPDAEVHAEGDLWVAGMDFGFRAPTVVLLARVDASGVLTIEHERSVEGVVLEKHIEAILTGLGSGAPAPAWIGVDPAGAHANDQTGESNVAALRRAGLKVRTRAMTIQAGLALVRARLRPASGAVTLFVRARCRRLIESLEKYHYPPENPQSLSPVKDGSDHGIDALRYLVQNLDRPMRTASANYLR